MQLTIKYKQLFSMLLAGLIPLAAASLSSFFIAEKIIYADKIDQLRVITTAKADKINRLIESIEKNVEDIQANQQIITDFSQLKNEMDHQGSVKYQNSINNLNAVLHNIQKKLELDNIYFLDTNGDVFYASDIGYAWQYLKKPLYSSLNLNWKLSKSLYGVSYSSLFINPLKGGAYDFLAKAPIYNATGGVIGNIVLEVSALPLYNTIEDNLGLGDTGETALAIKNKDIFTIISPLRFNKQSIFNTQLKLDTTLNAPYGSFNNYLNVPAVAFIFKIPKIDFYLITMMNNAEIFEKINKLKFLSYLTALLASILIFILALVITHSITQPLLKLTAAVRKSSRNELNFELDQDLLARTDEIGLLARVFKEKTAQVKQYYDELGEAQRKLLDVARSAGMAEVATTILHNVGNLLNSVKSIASLLNENLNEKDFKNLVALSKIISENLTNLSNFLTDDPKGKLIPPYLIALISSLDNKNKKNNEEIQRLHILISHIEDIVELQKTISGTGSILIEKIYMPDVIETAIKMCDAPLKKNHINLQVQIAEPIFIETDKSKVLQILVNLIQNASDALMIPASEITMKKINIVLKVFQNENKIKILISDNGVGIDEKNLVAIFSLGFTTKVNGHGFGLHSSANAAKELGGDLEVKSAGEGRGATFILTLPIIF